MLTTRRELILGGAALLGGYALGKPTRSALGASGTNGGAAAGWVNPYVTDGLVVQWDGEWNAGGGVHDPNATSWRELVSGTDCAIVGNLSTNYSWSGNSLVRNTENRGYFIYDATALLQDAFRAATFTIESVTSQPVNNANWQAQIINICQTSQTGVYSQGIIARWRREDIGSMGTLSSAKYHSGARTTLATRDALAIFACTYNAGQYVSYLDGEQKSTGSATPDSTIEGVWVRSGSVAYAFRGQYHSIRIYSRALTAAEIAANYAVDKARFGLP